MFGGDIVLQLAESVKDNPLNTSGVDDEVQRDSILALSVTQEAQEVNHS